MSINDIRRAPKDLTSLSDILAALASLEVEESGISTALTELVASDEPVDAALANLKALSPQFAEVGCDAGYLRDKVSSTAYTADRVGGRVRSLDEQMRRVRESSERVAQVLELKSSLSALHDATEKQDWETATRLCASAMAIPPDVVNGVFAEKTVPTSELHLPPSVALKTSREFLRDTFLKSFNQAARARDAEAISRFFKLFPPIGWDEEGLDAYSTFAVDLIQTRAPISAKTSSPLYYVTALTVLFESICNIVVQHQPVVEKYYGPLKMLRVVEALMRECDLAVERSLDGWKEERSISKKLSDVASFSFSAPVAPGLGSRSYATAPDDDTVDAREIDKVLNEMSAFSLRYSAFRRFMASNFEESSDEVPENDKEGGQSSPGLHLVDKSACHLQFEALIRDCYVPLEVWYLRSAIMKAHRTATIDSSQYPPTSSIPDLVFYILKAVLMRLINTGSMIAVQHCRRRIMESLRSDYADVTRQKLDDVFRTSSATKAGGNSDKEARQTFIMYLNDMEVSALHMERLIKDIVSSDLIHNNFLVFEVQEVEKEIHSLRDFGPKIKATLKSGTDQFFTQLIRPRLRTFLTDIYKDVSYVLDDDGYSTSEQQDVVRKRFVKNWEDITQNLKDTMAESIFRTIVDLVIDALIRPWEKFAVTLKYTELGAIRFDHDIRSIVTYLSTNTNFGDVREKFQRLQQISTVLNVDKDENLDEFYSSSGINWKFSLTDARAILELKI